MVYHLLHILVNLNVFLIVQIQIDIQEFLDAQIGSIIL